MYRGDVEFASQDQVVQDIKLQNPTLVKSKLFVINVVILSVENMFQYTKSVKKKAANNFVL